MILVDANLLLYAYDPDSPQHEASRRWLEEVLSGAGLVRFAWITLYSTGRDFARFEGLDWRDPLAS